jgi:hypothetical protein
VSTHLNEYRQVRDKAAEAALAALATEFGYRRMFERTMEIVVRVPAHEESASLRLYVKLLPRLSDRRALRTFLSLSEKVWELESEATPLPVHRGCPQD